MLQFWYLTVMYLIYSIHIANLIVSSPPAPLPQEAIFPAGEGGNQKIIMLGTTVLFSKGEGAPLQMRPVISNIRSAKLASGAIGGDARGRRPLAKKLRLSPFPGGEGGRGDGGKSLYDIKDNWDLLLSST